MEKLKKIKDFILKYRDILYFIFALFMIIFMINKCSSNNNLQDEIDRQKNNELTLKDSLSYYTDELGRMNAEKHAYQLTQDELVDSIDGLKKKNYEYVSYIKTQLGIHDTVIVNCIVEREIRDTSLLDNGTIIIDTSNTFGNSSRHLYVSIPYTIDTILHTDKGKVNLEQNVFVEGWLERNEKTGETYMHLRSDYPNMSFNSGTGIVAESSTSYEKSFRKTKGIGLFVGPSVGIGYTNSGWKPYVGASLGVGFNYTPRWLQW